MLLAVLWFALSSLATCPSALAQGHTLSIANVAVPPGSVISSTINLEIASGAATVEAWSFGVCHDAAALTLLDVADGGDFANPPDFRAVQLFVEGFTATAVVDLQTSSDLGQGTWELLQASYLAGGPSSTALEFCESLGDPPVVVVLSADSVEADPVLVNGVVEISGPPLDPEFVFQLPARNVYYDPNTGFSEFPIALSIDQTAGVDVVVGITAAFNYDPSLCVATGAQPRGVLEALNGGAGPEFFAANFTVGGVALDIDVGADLLVLTNLQPIVNVSFAANAAEMLAQGTPSTAFSFAPVWVGAQPAINSIAVNGAQTPQILFSHGVASFLPSPSGGPGGNGVKALFLGNATTATDDAVIPVSLDNDGTVLGFSYGVCHDPAVLVVQDLELGFDLLSSNGGNIVDFFSFEVVPPQGWTGAAVVSFDGMSSLTGSNNEIAVARYTVLEARDSTELTFCEIGTPLVEIVLVEEGPNVIVPDTVGGTLTFTSPVGGAPAENFRRGDVNNDGQVSALTDAIHLLAWGFTGGPVPSCLKSADVDDNGTLSALSDSLYLLIFQFNGGSTPAAPGETCGSDPTADSLSCVLSVCP